MYKVEERDYARPAFHGWYPTIQQFTLEEGAGLPGFTLSRSYWMLVEVYDENLHNHNGTHLESDIVNKTF